MTIAMLQLMVREAEDGREAPVTLYVKGLLVSGYITSLRGYLQARLREGAPPVVAALAKQDLDEVLTGLEQGAAVERLIRGDDASSEARWIYLRDVRTIAGGLALPLMGCWCGDIRSVDGCYFGLVQLTDPPASSGRD